MLPEHRVVDVFIVTFDVVLLQMTEIRRCSSLGAQALTSLEEIEEKVLLALACALPLSSFMYSLSDVRSVFFFSQYIYLINRDTCLASIWI